jgi:hypothetical protein
MVHPTPPNPPTLPTQTTPLHCQISEKLIHHNQKPPMSPPISPSVTSDNYNSLKLLTTQLIYYAEHSLYPDWLRTLITLTTASVLSGIRCGLVTVWGLSCLCSHCSRDYSLVFTCLRLLIIASYAYLG